MTPTPGQPLSEADRGPAGAVMDALWPLLGGSHTSADLWHEINDAVSEALSPHAPVSRPGDGVEGENMEASAWRWLSRLYPNDAPADLAYDANEMVDAFVAGAGEASRMAKALWRIAEERQYRAGYCQTDFAVEPALTAEEAQAVAREALSPIGPALTPPAEPVSRPAGEGEREAVARIVDPKVWELFDRGLFPDLMPSRKAADPSVQPAAGREKSWSHVRHLPPLERAKTKLAYNTQPPYRSTVLDLDEAQAILAALAHPPAQGSERVSAAHIAAVREMIGIEYYAGKDAWAQALERILAALSPQPGPASEGDGE